MLGGAGSNEDPPSNLSGGYKMLEATWGRFTIRVHPFELESGQHYRLVVGEEEFVDIPDDGKPGSWWCRGAWRSWKDPVDYEFKVTYGDTLSGPHTMPDDAGCFWDLCGISHRGLEIHNSIDTFDVPRD